MITNQFSATSVAIFPDKYDKVFIQKIQFWWVFPVVLINPLNLGRKKLTKLKQNLASVQCVRIAHWIDSKMRIAQRIEQYTSPTASQESRIITTNRFGRWQIF